MSFAHQDEIFEFTVDGIEGEDGIFANARVLMFKAQTTGRYQGFQKLCIFCNLLQETQACTTDIFVGALLEMVL